MAKRGATKQDLRVKRARFVGRDRELVVLDEWRKSDTRALSLVGTAGVGKTRLAREWIASAKLEPPPLFCDLTGCRDREDVGYVVQRALGVSASRLLDGLIDRVVILDGAEHLREGVRAIVSEWLDVRAGARFVITSRERLDLPIEDVLEVRPLGEDDAIALFESLTEGTVVREDAARIVRRFDRLPLAIGLAASRTSVVSPAELAERLDRGDRIDLGMGGAIRGSIDLLTDAERETLFACAAFESSFTASAVEAVLGSPGVVDRLSALRRKHLLWSEQSEVTMMARLHVFDAVRQLAREHDGTSFRDAHARHYLARAIGALAHRESLELVDDLADLMSAHRWLAPRDPRSAAQIVLAIDPLLHRNGPAGSHLPLLTTGIELAERSGDRELTARLFLARSRASSALDAAWKDCRAAWRVSRAIDDLALQAEAFLRFGWLERDREQTASAHRFLARARDLLRAAGDAAGESSAIDMLGLLAHDRGALAEAREHYEDALALQRATGQRQLEATTLSHLALAAHEHDRHEEAAAGYEASLELVRALGDRRREVYLLGLVSLHRCQTGDWATARKHMNEAKAIDARLGDERTRALLAAAEGTLDAIQDRIVDAKAAFARAKLASYGAGATTQRSVGVLEGTLSVALARRARNEGRLEEAARHFAAARKILDESRRARRLEIRLSTHVLASTLARSTQRARLRVAADASSFTLEPHASRSIARRRALRGLLRSLVDAHRARTGRGVSIDALFAAGWPNEKIAPASAARRVYVGIGTLRELGLRDVLITDEAGYLLDPDVVVEIEL
jgi:tetratricopeptide (TPR) repeat protein